MNNVSYFEGLFGHSQVMRLHYVKTNFRNLEMKVHCDFMPMFKTCSNSSELHNIMIRSKRFNPEKSVNAKI